MRILSRLGQFASFTAIVLVSQASAQPRRVQTTQAGAAQLETALQANPHDLSARSALLEYYFSARIDPAAAIAARRRHILWVIENAPEEQLAYGPAMTIDPAGHALADPKGFQLASAAWRAQAAKPDAKPMTLANAAYFFKTSDMRFTINLLQRAVSLDPASKEIGSRLGDEYALVILGVTMVNRSSYPLRNDPALARSSLAADCRKQLAESRNPYVLAKAGYQILWQGDILYHTGSCRSIRSRWRKRRWIVPLAWRRPTATSLRCAGNTTISEKREDSRGRPFRHRAPRGIPPQRRSLWQPRAPHCLARRRSEPTI